MEDIWVLPAFDLEEGERHRGEDDEMGSSPPRVALDVVEAEIVFQFATQASSRADTASVDS